jgi:hypothetical protein
MRGYNLPVRGHLTVAFAAALLACGSSVEAQQSPAAGAQPQGAAQASQPSQAQPPAQTTPPSPESMGVSLKSIRQNLNRLPPEKKSTATGMRYDFFVDVLGKRPAIDFFKDFDLSTKGGVRWGTPTHAEILSAVSPNWVTGAMPAGGFDVLSVFHRK